MLTYEDCLGLANLEPDEIDAIAEHEHLPQMVALELGAYLVRAPDGQLRIRAMIKDDIAAARMRGDLAHAGRLRLVLKHFCETHPAVRRG